LTAAVFSGFRFRNTPQAGKSPINREFPLFLMPDSSLKSILVEARNFLRFLYDFLSTYSIIKIRVPDLVFTVRRKIL
jgi:hypothetical protein